MEHVPADGARVRLDGSVVWDRSRANG